MGLLKHLSNLVFPGRKAAQASCALSLAQAAQGLLKEDETRVRTALMDIARVYKKRDNDYELAEAVMRLTDCYGNLFGKDKEVTLILDINQAAFGTHLETQMITSLSQSNPFTNKTTYIEGMERALRNKEAADLATQSLKAIMEKAGLPGIMSDKEGVTVARNRTGAPETPLTPMTPAQANAFCMEQRFFIKPPEA